MITGTLMNTVFFTDSHPSKPAQNCHQEDGHIASDVWFQAKRSMCGTDENGAPRGNFQLVDTLSLSPLDSRVDFDSPYQNDGGGRGGELSRKVTADCTQ